LLATSEFSVIQVLQLLAEDFADVAKRLIRTLNPTVEEQILDVWIAGLLREIAKSQSSATEAA